MTHWRGEYYNNETLSGSPVLVRNDVNIDFEWYSDSPDPVIYSDHFSARWTRTLYFSGGRYRFHVFHDDGARLWLDGDLVINEWHWGRETHTADVDLSTGQHSIKLEMYEIDGWAAAMLSWESLSTPTPTRTPTPTPTPTGIFTSTVTHTPTPTRTPTVTRTPVTPLPALNNHRISIPAISSGDELGTGQWKTQLHGQNVGEVPTRLILLGWGEYSGTCSAPGPRYRLSSGEIGPGAAMIWEIELPESLKSGIIYSVATEEFIAAWDASANALNGTESWLAWEALWEANWSGEPLAAVARRSGPNDFGTTVSSTYTGISRQMEGTGPPYLYSAPYVTKGYYGLDTELTIQNSGQGCTSVAIDYMEQGTCDISYTQHIEQLAPGEAVRVRVPSTCYWLGSARISAEVPLAIIVDETSFDAPCWGMDRGRLVTAKVEPYDDGLSGFELYGPMIFREISGWDTTVNVHNLNSLSETWVTVKFLDVSGGSILSLSDWVYANGSTTFYLPISTDLGIDYVGAVTIESLEREGSDPQPISAIVRMSKPDDLYTPQFDAQGASYNAVPQSLVEDVRTIALPFLARDGAATSAIGIRNNSNCNRLAAVLDIYEEAGLLASVPISIDPDEVECVAMNNIGVIPFTGSGILHVSVDEVLCGEEVPGAEVPMPSAVVVNTGLGFGTGDIVDAYEGIVVVSPMRIYLPLVLKNYSVSPD